MAPDTSWRCKPLALWSVRNPRKDDVFRNDLIPDNVTVIVDILNKYVQGVYPLTKTTLYHFPVVTLHYSRNDVIGPYPLCALIATIHSECDAHPVKGRFSGFLASKKVPLRQGLNTLY